MDPHEIARKMTKAQRRALLAFVDDDQSYSAKELGSSGACLNELMDFDRVNRWIDPPIMLVSRDYSDWPRLHWCYSIEPLGLAVRRILEEQRND